MLALATFCQFAPIFAFGLAGGALADVFNKRVVLVVCQMAFASGALFLAAATHYGFVRYEHILGVAVVFGLAQSIEGPTRQSTLSRVVPAEELPNAVPLQALTFNLARLVGPAIGGVLLAAFGAGACYLFNGLSYLALILAVLAIRADLSPERREPQPIRDLVMEGMLYTLREARLRTLFFLECAVALFGLPYLALMPAIAEDVLRLGTAQPGVVSWAIQSLSGSGGSEAMGKTGLGLAMSAIGVGAVCGLLLVANLSKVSRRPRIAMAAMTLFGLSLTGLGFTGHPDAAFVLFALIGMCGVAQFNSTNTFFQLLSPARLRGRVLSMHIWALAGLNPLGVLLLGWLSRWTGVGWVLVFGGLLVFSFALWGWSRRREFGVLFGQDAEAAAGESAG